MMPAIKTIAANTALAMLALVVTTFFVVATIDSYREDVPDFDGRARPSLTFEPDLLWLARKGGTTGIGDNAKPRPLGTAGGDGNRRHVAWVAFLTEMLAAATPGSAWYAANHDLWERWGGDSGFSARAPPVG